jgi:hypothetical protein
VLRGCEGSATGRQIASDPVAPSRFPARFDLAGQFPAGALMELGPSSDRVGPFFSAPLAGHNEIRIPRAACDRDVSRLTSTKRHSCRRKMLTSNGGRPVGVDLNLARAGSSSAKRQNRSRSAVSIHRSKAVCFIVRVLAKNGHLLAGIWNISQPAMCEVRYTLLRLLTGRIARFSPAGTV